MKIAYFDCIAGVSGDMILGALVDAGLTEARLRERLSALEPLEFSLEVRKVDKNGFGATKVDVLVNHHVHARALPDIEALVTGTDLPLSIKDTAIRIFRRMGEVEAGIHGTTIEQVHLHELGGVDTIIDVVGALVGLEELGIDRIEASPLPVGRGFIQGAHGTIPLPAPATVGLLAGVPVVGSPLDVETVTPTGAAILSSLVTTFGPIPPMRLVTTGYGAGSRDLSIPNLLRLMVGESSDTLSDSGVLAEAVAVLETNIDDLNPEFYDHVMTRLLAEGALDVFLSPIQMKKNRPATLLQVLAKPADADKLTRLILMETTTLGVRRQIVARHCLVRSSQTVDTQYGPVRIKTARWGEDELRVKPEYDDCRRLAEELHLPLHVVYRAAEQAARDASAG